MNPPVASAPVLRHASPTPPALWHSLNREQWGTLSAPAAGAFITSLDSAIVGISLPAISRAFNVPVGGSVEWVTTAYLVAVATLLLSVGRLSDLFSRAPLWLGGIAVFSLGSILCAAAPNLELLILARVVQGIGGALIVATGVSILGGDFPEAERGRALGIIGLASAASSCLGPVLGGTITDHLHWRLIFLINVPIGLVTFIAGRRYLPRLLQLGAQRFDLLGSLLIGAGLASALIVLWFGQAWGWSSPRFLTALGIVLAILATAIFVERHATNPLLDCGIFRSPQFSPALSRLICSRLALMVPSFLLPFYLIELRGFSGQSAGLLLIPFPIAVMVASPIAGALADRSRPHVLEILGLALVAASLLGLARLDTGSSLALLVALLLLLGLGQGIFTAPNSKAILDAAPANEEGQASGLLSVGRVIGQSLSIAFASSIFALLGSGAAGRFIAEHTGGISPAELLLAQDTFLDGFRAALLVGAGFALLGALTLLLQHAPGLRQHAPKRPAQSAREVQPPRTNV